MLETMQIVVLPVMILSIVMFALVMQLAAAKYVHSAWDKVDAQCDNEDLEIYNEKILQEEDTFFSRIEWVVRHVYANLNTNPNHYVPSLDQMFDFSDVNPNHVL
jgi:hypothetical protein